MSDVLNKILAVKHDEIQRLTQRYSMADLEALAALQSPPRGFIKALDAQVAQGKAGVIAEIKKASPSKGVIRADFDPAWIAEQYAQGGAACLSVLTDETFFQGHNAYLVHARARCKLPVIRKDFLIASAQIVEARAIGADCVLLIVAALAPAQLQRLAEYAVALGMDVLVEVHDLAELQTLLNTPMPPYLLGINNRSLRSFVTSLNTTLDLLTALPAGTPVVTESGIGTRADVALMQAAGVHRFLIGESLMRQPLPSAALQALL